MNSDIMKSLIIRNDYYRVANYVIACLRSKIPVSKYKDVCDWEQDMSLYIMLHKTEILAAHDAPKFVFKSMWNKIKNEYRSNTSEYSALEGLRGAIEMLPTSSKHRDEGIVDSVLRLAIHELKVKFPGDLEVNKLLLDYVTGGENHTRDRILELMSKASFHRRKNFVTGMIKNNLNAVLEQEPPCR